MTMSTNPRSTQPGAARPADHDPDEAGTSIPSPSASTPEPSAVHPPSDAFRATRVSDESLAAA
ncbi:hypothetical protein DZF93_14715, partial [Clavibacter michiganensis subsp. insidiosus]